VVSVRNKYEHKLMGLFQLRIAGNLKSKDECGWLDDPIKVTERNQFRIFCFLAGIHIRAGNRLLTCIIAPYRVLCYNFKRKGRRPFRRVKREASLQSLQTSVKNRHNIT
jgi:hypothetical protein